LFINPIIYINKFILIYSSINNILKSRKSTGKIGDFYKILVIIFFIILVLPLNIINIVLSDKKFTI